MTTSTKIVKIAIGIRHAFRSLAGNRLRMKGREERSSSERILTQPRTRELLVADRLLDDRILDWRQTDDCRMIVVVEEWDHHPVGNGMSLWHQLQHRSCPNSETAGKLFDDQRSNRMLH